MGCCWSDKKKFEGEVRETLVTGLSFGPDFLSINILQGQRLGTGSNDTRRAQQEGQYRDDPLPQPAYDPNLSDEAREKMRADRAAAAESRLKKMGATGGKKKGKKTNIPLRGPNTEPTMRWTA